MQCKDEQHRLRHRGGIAIDLVPFGGLETTDRRIAWPPRGEMSMGVFGFREAPAAACEVLLPAGVQFPVVSLPALVLLKFVAWDERHTRSRGKDAPDLMLILRNYRSVGDNAARLFDQFLEWTQHEGFDVEESGARMLGHDMRRLLNEAGVARAAAIIRPQARLVSGELAADMDRRSPGRAHRLLQALFDEFLQARV